MRQFVVALAVACAALPAAAGPFSGIYFFGDSLTDTGNVTTLYAGLPKPPGAPAVIPGAPYDAEGRSSNGPIYADVLAAGLGFTATASLRGGGDYAYGGARTRYESPFGPPFPGIIGQVAGYTSTHAADPTALYVVWGGSNNLQDIITGRTTDLLGNPIPGVSGTLSDMGSILNSLYAAGARDLLVPNVADLGLTPRVRELGGAAGQALADQLVQAYNNGLSGLLDGFAAAHPDAHVFRFDTYSFFNGVVAHPADFGFTNTTDRCYTGDDVGFSGGGAVCANPGSYVFWDGIHPTTAAHGLLGEAMLQAVPEPGTYALLALGLAMLAAAARRPVRSGARTSPAG